MFLTRLSTIYQGFALALLIAVFAMLLGGQFPLIGAPVTAIILGMLIKNISGVKNVFRPGLQFSSKYILQFSIVGLGFGLSLKQVVNTGIESLTVTITTVIAAVVAAWFISKSLGISKNLNVLIGVGTAICGGSAIAAVTPIIKAQEHETAFAIATIFIFNVVAVFMFPAFGHWFGMSDNGFGMWAGTAINDTSSVVAAAYSYSTQAGDYATIVKLTRATLIIPICLILIALQIYSSKKTKSSSLNLRKIFPWFILWFVVAASIRSSGVIPVYLDMPISFIANFSMVVALAAIGLSSDLSLMKRAGLRPVLLGLGVWVAVIISSLLTQKAIGLL